MDKYIYDENNGHLRIRQGGRGKSLPPIDFNGRFDYNIKHTM